MGKCLNPFCSRMTNGPNDLLCDLCAMQATIIRDSDGNPKELMLGDVVYSIQPDGLGGYALHYEDPNKMMD